MDNVESMSFQIGTFRFLKIFDRKLEMKEMKLIMYSVPCQFLHEDKFISAVKLFS